MDTRERVFQFFVQQQKAEGLTYETELLKSKYINSLFAMQIVLYVEKEFGIKLKRKDISEQNFRTINDIAALVDSKLQ